MSIQGMDFSSALVMLKEGHCVQRTGWNGKGMYIYLVDGSTFVVNRPPLNKLIEEGIAVKYRSHIDMRTAQGDFVPWIASQTDLLADDWRNVAVRPDGSVAQAELML